tara:strand:- start:28 stop:213 length:186 start_codon:yes stop_codon:yes gene_type:complete
MRAQQLTITFPKHKVQYKEELMRMKFEEQTNISAYVLDCIEKELGYVDKIKSSAGLKNCPA